MFSLSPDINVREFDTSQVVPAVATSITGMVGKFSWGPCFDRTQVTREMDLLELFRGPKSANAADWFSAAEFLRYGNNLWIVRAVDATTAKNAGIAVNDEDQVSATTALSANPYIPNLGTVPSITFAGTEKLQLVAKYPGTDGNTIIKVALCSADDFSTALVETGVPFKGLFEYAPQSGIYDYHDQVAIVVSVKNILDENFQVVERWIVDLDPTAKDVYGKSNYIENVINERSNWIYAFDNTTVKKSPKSFQNTFLSGGVAGDPDTGDIILGYDEFRNPEDFTVNILIDGANTVPEVQGAIIDICEERKDCLAVLSVPPVQMVGLTLSTAVENCVTYRTTSLNRNTTYAAMYANAKQVFDKYNDTKHWIPVSGDMAGLMADVDKNAEPWYAPAGLTRGQMRNVYRLAISPSKGYRDTLHSNSLNVIVGSQGDGYVVWSQKCLTSIPSAFSRINVRRLFIVLEKAIATASKTILFDFNDEYTRNMFRLMVDPFLRRVQSLRGIYEYKIICDETNNTPYVIDNHGFVADIMIKPERAIENIVLNFVATATGVSFEEVTRNF